ncbi:MAG: YlxR family protein [Actinobacteria bacterium]|nr:YlxR family protein [Actinomycetota bacterium]
MAHEPQRRCTGCGRSAPKRSLLRWVAVGDAVVADPDGRLPGRGAYTCRTRRCVERAGVRGGFARSFRRAVTAPRSGENVHLDEE